MKPSAKQEDLLYVSDAKTYEVYVYDYKTREQVGSLSEFDNPGGQCVDANGDIFITSTNSGVVQEYAHGGTVPIATLSTGANTLPIACSVSGSGDLAVMSFTPSEISIFKKASGTPSVYSCNECTLEPGTYDGSGNLIVPGLNNADKQVFYAILLGSNAITTLSFNSSAHPLGAATWDGQDIAVIDNARRIRKPGPGILQFALSGSTLKLVGETHLNDNCNGKRERPYFGSAFVVGTKNTPVNDRRGHVVIANNGACQAHGYSKVDYWAYPRGRTPTASIVTEHEEPTGLSVSIAITK